MPRHASIEWADEPVSTANDKLGRSLQARAMAEKINKDHSWDQSRVYGLTGSWGSGKTSMINMIVDELRRQPDGSPPWAIAHFTPWSANDADTLVQEFYAALAERLPNRSPARQKIVNLAVAASPLLNAIPIIGGGVEAAMVGVLERLGETGPWQAQFDAACTALRETKQRMLIIADDIDRLQTAELFRLFELNRAGGFGVVTGVGP